MSAKSAARAGILLALHCLQTVNYQLNYFKATRILVV